MSTLERSPQAIGDYSLLRELDPAGGMGRRAYLALRRTMPGSQRLYVVKLLDLEGSARTRAMQQMARAKELDHPAIAPLTESLEHEGSLVAVFEHLEGLRLDQIQQHLERAREQLSDLAIWHIAHQMLGALECAHGAKDERGRPLQLVHGNLGPDRVHISWDGEVRVFGVGVPSVFDDTHRSDFALAFRAPERRQGMASGPQSDVYSAAALLWSLLTGKTPSTDSGQLAKLGTLRTDLPAKATTVLDSALERSWARRKVTCQHIDDALAAAFERIDDASELRWNMEVFRALSVFSQSQAPPPAALPQDPTALPAGIAQARQETTDGPAPTAAELTESLAETKPQTGAKPRPAPQELLPRREAPTVPRAQTEPRPTPQELLPRREAATVPRVRVGGPAASIGSGAGKKLRASTVLGVGPGNLRDQLERAEDALVEGLGKPAEEPGGGAAASPAPAAATGARPPPTPTTGGRKALASVPILRIPVSAKTAEEMRRRGAGSDDYRPTVPVAKPGPTVGRDEAHAGAGSPRIGLLGLRSQRSAAPPRPDSPSGAEESQRGADQPADAEPTAPPRADPPAKPDPEAEPEDGEIDVVPIQESDFELSAEEIARIAADDAGVEDLLGFGESEPPKQADVMVGDPDVAPAEPATGADEPESVAPSTPPPISFPPPKPRKSEPTAEAAALEASPATPAPAPQAVHPQPPTPEPAHPQPPIPGPTAAQPAPVPPTAPEPAADGPPAPAAATPQPVEPPAPPAAPPSPAPRRGISPAVALGGMVLMAAVAFVAAWFLRPMLEPTGDADALPAAAPSAPPDPTQTASPPPGDSSAEPGSTELDAGTAAPEPSADAAAEEPEPTTDELPPIQDDIPAGDKLLSYQGYLVVRSRAKADVYVQGKQVGPTNTKNKTSCWTRHVKLRDPATQKWLTPGQPVRIVCMETNTVTIDP